MELKEGMYVRHKSSGHINKILEIKDDKIMGKILCMDKYPMTYLEDDFDDLISSNTIIDLIEVGDYANGFCVSQFKKYIEQGKIVKKVDIGNENFIWLGKENIESVVTKEQMESITYYV